MEDPEQKRKIIGHEFIHLFEAEAAKLGRVRYLAQGTLYPDVIESVSFKGPSATIKSHHNVGGLPEVMKLELVEPLRELFKDEVRQVGVELGLPDELVWRQPFPRSGSGRAHPGRSDSPKGWPCFRRPTPSSGRKSGPPAGCWPDLSGSILPCFCRCSTVGVMGDQRTYESVAAIRVVDSLDAMTADWTRVPYDILAVISNQDNK